ncbi:MAG TPA: DUF1501 domain-containing protein [Candidatus Dormibacteraeota bacterium]|nr:DUF1501 domain-containing protein [Candidatus Dormibacteraeota bacterium]
MSKQNRRLRQLARRDVLKAGLVLAAGGEALKAGYAAVPDAFARGVYAANREGLHRDQVLVMIQLAGGNDGLRTVVPLRDNRLHDLRPTLAGASVSGALALDTEVGLHSALTGIKALWDQGRVAIVHGVGYPDPSYSHFESIRVWETGDPSRRQVDGWIGRMLTRGYDSAGHPLTGCACGTTSTPGMMRDVGSTVAVIQDRQSYGFAEDDLEAVVGSVYRETPGIYGALFDTTVATLRHTIAELDHALPQSQDGSDTQSSYSQSAENQLAQALKLGAQLIIAGTGVRLLHVTLDGFDTHYAERDAHDQLMGFLDESISGFYAELAQHGMASKVLLATWSEFGRRPGENVTGGTDHGSAAPLLLIGDPIRGGRYGREPDLGRLDGDGNLTHTVDFRSVYQEILDVHFGTDPREILGGTFEPVRFLRPT